MGREGGGDTLVVSAAIITQNVCDCCFTSTVFTSLFFDKNSGSKPEKELIVVLF